MLKVNLEVAQPEKGTQKQDDLWAVLHQFEKSPLTHKYNLVGAVELGGQDAHKVQSVGKHSAFGVLFVPMEPASSR